MPITIHPRIGQILVCDFSKGFKEPEMVKDNRPVIVISPPMRGRPDLVTVVALSTKPPYPVFPYHCQLPKACLPMLGRFQQDDTWIKGDMVYSVGFHRLNLIRLNQRDPNTGKRTYFTRRLGREWMKTVYGCVLEGMNIGHLSQHL